MFVTTRVTFVRDVDGFDGKMTFSREVEDVYELAAYNGDVARAMGFTYVGDFVPFDENDKPLTRAF